MNHNRLYLNNSISDANTAVLIEDLRKSYGKVIAVDSVSLQVKSGEIFGLLGPNGAGKTTTLRCLCTLAKPDTGRIEIAGINVLDNPRGARQYLGYVAQEVALDKMLTGRELMELQAAIYHLPKRAIADRITSLLSRLGLTEWADRLIGTYSGGLKKRLDLATGLLHQPSVLVLDEPTAGLDIESRTVTWAVLRQLQQQGMTIVITSHYLEEIDALADRVAILDRGRVIALGTPDELKQQVGGDRITLRLREFTPLEEAERARNLLLNLPQVRSVIVNAAQGNSLNLVADAAPKTQGTVMLSIQQSLQAEGFPIFAIAQSRPSLDDVYLAATGQTLLDAELAALSQRDPQAERKQALKSGQR
ncbi:MAG: ABC transporter ATP-binding protein [Synechococcales bacterium]|nr:ABC transporter ATP-binding protein [Synechococcales bacterium]